MIDEINSDIADPYIDRGRTYSDDEEEFDDFRIKPIDNLILCGHVEEDSITLEVKIYNENDGHFVHHENYLSAYPLCFQWLGFDQNSSDSQGNFVAIGDMEEDISLWNLDVVDSIEPSLTLKGHRKSVLDLDWHPNVAQRLASCSADKKCLFWDLQNQNVSRELNNLKNKFQSISFHPSETNALLAGDEKGNAKIIDCCSDSMKNWRICKEELEKVVWLPRLSSNQFLCATSNGVIYQMDSRNENSHLFAVKAHDEMISGLELRWYQNHLQISLI